MNDLPRRKLREIIDRHGRSVVDDPRRCEGLLRDHCGQFKREISVLIAALEERTVDALPSAPPGLPKTVLLNRVAKGLSDDRALSRDAAEWSIWSWAWALGVISDAELSEAGRTEQDESARSGETGTTPVLSGGESGKSNQRAARPPSIHAVPQGTGKVTAPAPVLVVSPSAGDFHSISEALKTAEPGSRIVIREGLYRESIEITANVDIVGEGALENIVIRSDTRSCISLLTEKASVTGISIEGRGTANGNSFFAVDVTQGELRLHDCNITSDSLSCVAIHGVNASMAIKNCRIHDSADSGIYVFDNARALVENCEVYRNTNVNIAVTQGANPVIRNCRVFEGDSGGIVVWGNGATGSIEDCEIYGHRLANVGIRESANPIFKRCKITGSRDTGVLVQQGGYSTFVECDIYSNAKAEVAVADSSNTTIRQCNIHKGQGSGVVLSDLSRAVIENSNIYDNRDAGVLLDGESAASIRECHIRRNGTVAVRLTGRSAARVEDCDLRGNRVAVWGSDHGTTIERKNNRER